MQERIAEADAAFKAGRIEDGIRISEALLTDEPRAPQQVFRNFAALLFRRQLYDKAAHWARQGTKAHPRDVELWNILGVALRRLGRLDEAREALDAGLAVQPKNEALLQNKGNVLNDLRDGPGAVASNAGFPGGIAVRAGW